MYCNDIPFEYAKEFIDILPKVSKWFEDKGCTVLKKSFIGNKKYVVFKNTFVVFEESIPPDIKERFLEDYNHYLQKIEKEHSKGNFSDNLIQ